MCVIVTGSHGALGREVCRVLGGAGLTVVGIDRPNVGQGAVDPDVEHFGIDLTDEEKTRAGFKKIADQFGPVQGLVNIAGGFRWELAAEAGAASFDAMWTVNLKTALHASLAVLPYADGQGASIVNIGAAAAAKAAAGMGAYAASKAAVARLTEAMADELKGKGVRVNAVLPTIIDTPANRADMPDADFTTWATPHEVAQVIAFLLSKEASALTGALIPVNGRI